LKKSVAAAWLVVAAVLLAGCATTFDVTTDHNPGAPFAAYKTFAYMPGQTLIVASSEAVSPLLPGRLMDAATTVLVAQGFRRHSDPEQADFVMSFTLGARDQIRVDSYPASYRGTWGWGTRYYQEVDVRVYTKGTLAIDVFDVRSRQPVWHGRTSKTITSSDRKNPTPVINEIVAAILAEFPPG
jgi:hypothetical protein